MRAGLRQRHVVTSDDGRCQDGRPRPVRREADHGAETRPYHPAGYVQKRAANPSLASATLDRRLHPAVVDTFCGESYRMKGGTASL